MLKKVIVIVLFTIFGFLFGYNISLNHIEKYIEQGRYKFQSNNKTNYSLNKSFVDSMYGFNEIKICYNDGLPTNINNYLLFNHILVSIAEEKYNFFVNIDVVRDDLLHANLTKTFNKGFFPFNKKILITGYASIRKKADGIGEFKSCYVWERIKMNGEKVSVNKMKYVDNFNENTIDRDFQKIIIELNQDTIKDELIEFLTKTQNEAIEVLN